MDKTHIPSGNKREARPRFIPIDAALHRKPSMAAVLREGLRCSSIRRALCRKTLSFCCGGSTDYAKAFVHTMFRMFRMRLTSADGAPHVPPSTIAAKGQKK